MPLITSDSFFQTTWLSLKNVEIWHNCLCYIKILHNVNYPIHFKLPQFAKLIRITQHTDQQNDKAFVLASYKNYQLSRCFICPTTCLWNILPNKVVLAVKHDYFIALAKKYFVCSITIINTYVDCFFCCLLVLFFIGKLCMSKGMKMEG